MNVFLAIRYVTFALLVLLAGLTASFAALNVGFISSGVVSTESPATEGLGIYLVALSLLNILFILLIIAIEFCRKGALTSRIWFEFIWVVVFFVSYLGGSISTFLLIPGSICQAARQTEGTSKLACMTSWVLIAFTCIITSLYLLYLFALLVYSLNRSQHESKVWSSSVVDQPKRSSSVPPVLITHTYSQSIDGPSNVHHISFNDAISPVDDSLILEKEMKRRESGIKPPVFTRNPVINGPPTFGKSQQYEPKSGIDIGQANAHDINQRSLGVDAINGAPNYRTERPAGGYQLQKHLYRASSGNPNRASSPTAGHSQYPQQEAPWLSGEETPSPAVIKHASRVTPSVSLYPVHIVNAGLTTQPVKPKTPTALSTLTGFLHPTSQRESKTSLPYMNISRGTSQRSIASASISRNSVRHSQSQGVDSFVQISQVPRGGVQEIKGRASYDERSIGRGRRSRPLLRPPPLNLLGLSNISNAERR